MRTRAAKRDPNGNSHGPGPNEEHGRVPAGKGPAPRDLWIARAAIVVAWFLVSGASMSAALYSVERNSIDAVVEVRSYLDEHWVSVTNSGSAPWQDVRIVLPGDWVYHRATLRPQERILVPVTDFSRELPGGRRLRSIDLRPNAVSVTTRAGTYRHRTSRE